MKLTSKPLAIVIVLLLFGGIAFSTWMGWWQTETTRVPATYTTGDLAGQYNPSDIRGSYTFGDVSTLFDIPIADFQVAFHLPADVDPAGVALKDLEAMYADLPFEIGTASVRMFTAYYKGLPYEPTEDTYLFAEAIEILTQQGFLTVEQLEYLKAHSTTGAAALPEPAAVLPEPAADLPTVQPTMEATQHVPEVGMVGGKTTLQNMLDWGVSQEALEGILGSPLPPGPTILKDYCTQKGLTFSEIKTQLQAAVDSLP